MLSRRALSVREVADRLLDRGHDPAAVRAEVNRLRQAGLLDDRRLAEAVVHQQLLRGRGRRQIGLELRRRGLSAPVAAAALAALTEDAEREALAASLARARRRHPGPLRFGPDRKKVIRYLLSRGFSAGDVRAAVEAAAHEDGYGADLDECEGSGEFP